MKKTPAAIWPGTTWSRGSQVEKGNYAIYTYYQLTIKTRIAPTRIIKPRTRPRLIPDPDPRALNHVPESRPRPQTWDDGSRTIALDSMGHEVFTLVPGK
jgi:hypothetical protein